MNELLLLPEQQVSKCAHISDCGKYRYSLTREWDMDGQRVMFIGLNPSTADGYEDDPTIRRCMAFARDWGFGGIVMANLFSYRATSPKDMMAASDPIDGAGDRLMRLNDFGIRTLIIAHKVTMVVACWGVHGAFKGRDVVVRKTLADWGIEIYHLGLTKDGHPKHPLYLRADTKPELWRPA